MRVRTIDDEIFAAGTPEELVEMMALASYGEAGAVEEVVPEFVAQTAARVRALTGAQIRVGSARELLEDLLREGYLKQLDDEPDGPPPSTC
jgi:hypothetical protein